MWVHNNGLRIPRDTAGVGVAQYASAQDSDNDARQLFEAGQVLYESGEFEQAGRMFERSYALSQRTSLLYNAYLAYRDGQFQVEAARVLRQYLDQPDAQDRARLAPRLEALERANARGAAAEPEVSGGAEPTAPPEEQPEEQHSESPSTPVDRESPSSGRSPLGPVLVGAGGVVLVVGGVMGIMATKDANTLEDRCVNFVCSPDDIGLRDRSQRRGNASTALLVGGGVTAAIGVLVWVLSGRDDEESEVTANRPRLDFGCDGQGCAAAVRGTF